MSNIRQSRSCECSLFVKRFKSVCVNFPTRARHTPILVQPDNEYFQSGFGNAEYFAELETTYNNSSIVVPLTYNDPNMERNFVNGTVWTPTSPLCGCISYAVHSHRVPWTFTGMPGFVLAYHAAHLIGGSLDSYPQRFDCSHPELWNPVVTNYYEYHKGSIFFPGRGGSA